VQAVASTEEFFAAYSCEDGTIASVEAPSKLQTRSFRQEDPGDLLVVVKGSSSKVGCAECVINSAI